MAYRAKIWNEMNISETVTLVRYCAENSRAIGQPALLGVTDSPTCVRR